MAKGSKLQKQKLKKMSVMRDEAAKAEVQRWLYAEVNRPVQYEPFVLAEMIKPGTFRLVKNEGVEITHTWNADNLHSFYL